MTIREGTDTADTGQNVGERRHVTLLFTDVCDSTPLANAMDPEELQFVMRKVKDLTKEVIRDHAGLVNQDYGDGVMAMFGYPTAGEDDVLRATDAAIDLHDAVKRLEPELLLPHGFDLRFHSGIHSGLVFAVTGDDSQGHYELTGDTVNVTARLCSQSAPDEITVSAETLRGVSGFFETEALEVLRLRGVDQPIEALRVLGRSSAHTRLEARGQRGLTRFVGRSDELATLEESLAQARQGKLAIAAIIGDPGLGKTRTAQEFLDRAADVDIQSGYCEGYGIVAPLQPFLSLLRRMLTITPEFDVQRSAEVIERAVARIDERLRKHVPTLLHMLDLSAATDSRRMQTAMLEAVTDLFVSIASRRTLILFVDDWQWADDASLRVLESVAEAVADLPVLLLVAARSLDPKDRVTAAGRVLELQPFTKAESEQTVRSLLPDWVDLGVTTRIHEQSGGNALFIEELCEAQNTWTPEDVPVQGSSRVKGVPGWLYGLIETRVGCLPEVQANLVHSAAVIGTEVPVWLLQRLGGHDNVLIVLEGNDLVHPNEQGDTLRFKHGITREVVYHSVRLKQRQAQHLRIAQILEERASLGDGENLFEMLAYHYSRGLDHQLAAHYAELAGDKAFAAFSLDRAREQYRTAITHLEQVPETADVNERLFSVSERWGRACVYSPARDQLDVLQRISNRARKWDKPDAVAQAEYLMGMIRYSLGDQLDAVVHYDEALRISREHRSDKLAVQIVASLGQSYAAACDYEPGLAHLDEAIEIKRRNPSASHFAQGSSYALACRGLVLGDQGDFAGAMSAFETALEAVRGSGHQLEGSILALQGAVFIWQGRWDEASTVSQRAHAISQRSHGPYVFAMNEALSGYVNWVRGGSAEALEQLILATTWLEDWEMLLFSSFPYGWLTDALASARRDDEARIYAGKAVARAGVQDRLGEAMAYRAMAKIAGRSEGGKMASPDHYLKLAMNSARLRGSKHERAVTQMHQAESLIFSRRANDAQALLASARRSFAEMGMYWHDAAAAKLEQSS